MRRIRFVSGRDKDRKVESKDIVIPFTPKEAVAIVSGIIAVTVLVVFLGYVIPIPLAEFLNHHWGIGNKAAIQKVEIEDLKDIHDTIGPDSYTVHFVYSEIFARDKNDAPPPEFKTPYMWVTFTYRLSDGGITDLTTQLQQLKGVEPNGVNVKTFSIAVRKADEMKWVTLWQEVQGVLKSYMLSHPNKN